MPEIYPYGRDAPEGTYFAERRGGFDRGAGGPGEEWDPGSANNSASASAAAELARMWASAGVGIEPSPTDYPGMFSAFHYATVAQQLIDDAFPPGSGTNGYVLTADDSEPSGVKWAPQSMGSFLPLAGGTMTGNIVLGADDLTIGPSNPAHTAKLVDGYGDSIMEWSGGTSAYFPAGIIADNGTANPSITSMTGFGLGFDDPPVIWRSLTGSGVRFRTGQFYVTGYKVFELHETGALVLPPSTVTGSEPNGSIYQSSTTLLYRDQSGVAHDLLAGGGATNLTYNAATRVIASDTGTDATLPLVTSSDAGLAPASGGGTTNFLRADGTWAAPPGSGGAVATDAIWDAKGDLAVGTGADTASKLSVGTDGHVLTADSSTATGLKWAAVSGGSGTPGGSNTQIQFNDGGSFGGDADFTWDKTNNVLTFGSSARVRGPMSNGAASTDVALQTSDANSATIVSVIPNGTGTTGVIRAGSSSTFAAGGNFGQFGVISNTYVGLSASKYNPVGSNGLDIRIQQLLSGATREVAQFYPSGNVNFGTTTTDPSVPFRVEGAARFNGKLSLNTPLEAWDSGYEHIDMGTTAVWAAGAGAIYICNNLRYHASSWKYKTTAAAALNFISGTDWYHFTAPSGSAGAAATITQRLRWNESITTFEVGGGVTISGASIPQNSQSTAYTLVAADANKHILHPSSDTTARTFTIPANSSVPYAIGTALTFVNQNSAGVVTIAITSDTMRLAGAGTTGSRTLAANGIATALKITSTEWIISGTGLT